MSKRSKEILIIICFCCLPLLFITGCGSSGCFGCSKCEAYDCLVCAGGTEDKVTYRTCVGPAGCLGCGLNTIFWPTECVQAKATQDDNLYLKGTVIYYNGFGSIKNSEVKSRGNYSAAVGCLGIKCFKKEYIENADEDTTKGKIQNSCFCFSCGGKKKVEPKYYNESMPRKYKNGCWNGNN